MAECFVFQGCVCQKLTMQNTIDKFWPYVFAMYVYFLRKLKHEPKNDTMNISVEKGSEIFSVSGVFSVG